MSHVNKCLSLKIYSSYFLTLSLSDLPVFASFDISTTLLIFLLFLFHLACFSFDFFFMVLPQHAIFSPSPNHASLLWFLSRFADTCGESTLVIELIYKGHGHSFICLGAYIQHITVEVVLSQSEKANREEKRVNKREKPKERESDGRKRKNKSIIIIIQLFVYGGVAVIKWTC